MYSKSSLYACLAGLFVVLFMALFSLAAHAHDYDELVGTYSLILPNNNSEVDMVRIDKEKSNYFIYVNQAYMGIQWQETGDLARPADKEGYEKLLEHAKFDESFMGLETDNFAILKLPQGWKSGPYQTRTGYLWISAMGALEVTKKPLTPPK